MKKTVFIIALMLLVVATFAQKSIVITNNTPYSGDVGFKGQSGSALFMPKSVSRTASINIPEGATQFTFVFSAVQDDGSIKDFVITKSINQKTKSITMDSEDVGLAPKTAPRAATSSSVTPPASSIPPPATSGTTNFQESNRMIWVKIKNKSRDFKILSKYGQDKEFKVIPGTLEKDSMASASRNSGILRNTKNEHSFQIPVNTDNPTGLLLKTKTPSLFEYAEINLRFDLEGNQTMDTTTVTLEKGDIKPFSQGTKKVALTLKAPGYKIYADLGASKPISIGDKEAIKGIVCPVGMFYIKMAYSDKAGNFYPSVLVAVHLTAKEKVLTITAPMLDGAIRNINY